MTTLEAMELTPAEATARVRQELSRADEKLQTGELDSAFDGYALAIGLALQLGPALTEKALAATLDAARELAGSQDAEGLSALGPALVDLVAQVRDASALPPTTVMDAWASVVTEVGALIGQVGLALAMRADHRHSMMDNARFRAALLDDATSGLFALTSWLDQVDSSHNRS